MYYNRLFDVDEWTLKTTQLHREHIRLQESLTSLGNGYMGMRGNFEETYSGDHHQGTYIAGIWYPDKTRVGWWKIGYPDYFGKVINAINLVGLRIWIDQEEIDLFIDHLEQFQLELDMKKAVLRHSYIVKKPGKMVKIEIERFFSIVHKEIAAIRFRATNLGKPATIKLMPYLDGNVKNEDANYDEMFWTDIHFEVNEKRAAVITETIENPFGVPRFTVAATMGCRTDAILTTHQAKPLYAEQIYEKELGENESLHLEKIIAVTTSRDYEKELLLSRAYELLDQALESGYEELFQEHAAAWQKRWDKADVRIVGDPEAQQGIRFNLFQLFSTYYGDDPRLNIGPKGFTGEKYGGATYWDTEAYAVPMYLSVASPEVTRNLLLYRYNHLPQAYENAKKLGLKGALYPMVTFTGIECHNEWEITFEEIHRNGAIAYAIYNYVNYTGDKEYINQYGIDVLVGISRFFADRVHFSERKQKYMIHGVTGPNEYENNVNNNWYTNRIAVWTLKFTIASLDKIGKDKKTALNITEKELTKWRDIIDRMYFPYDEKLGIFLQQDGFLDKPIQPVSAIPREDLPLNQHWSWDRILRSCYIKQADVLQGFYFFNDEFTMEEKQRHFEFYEPLTVHESSLSPCVHAILAAELRKEDKAVELYKRTSRLDLDNYNHDTEDGLHITSMTGSWLAIVHGFAGMRTFNETLSFAPFLPKIWDAYAFKINYRNRLLEVKVNKKHVTVSLLEGEPLELKLFGEPIYLTNTDTKEYV
ncbi:glycoside hydrolase family 65 protein [Caldifermentibacillus hisashii]|uniref:glycoside hydrolase family 65 protein n=1 Tax=Caldifermentibacillus hisashii TaxID=996558 RepID=UPI0031010DFC